MTTEPSAGEPRNDVPRDPLVRDPADDALARLLPELDRAIAALTVAREQAIEAQRLRRAGRSWYGIAVREQRPVLVEQISAVLASLSDAGAAWRREKLRILRAENVPRRRIAVLFGVTHQRVSALLAESPERPPREGFEPHTRGPVP